MMFENIGHFFKRMVKPEQKELGSKDAAKERLHLVLMQDRANVSADFLELMKQEIIDVIKKYIVVDENAIDVRLTNQSKDDGTTGAPALYANIPIVNIKNDMMAEKVKEFEGVDFNKEMGLVTPDSEEIIDEVITETENVIEQEEQISEIKEETEKEEESIEEKSEEILEEIIEENVNSENSTEDEIKENVNDEVEDKTEENIDDEIEDDIQNSNVDYVDDEDDDDDVTFDDLLKAAEEEDKKQKK